MKKLLIFTLFVLGLMSLLSSSVQALDVTANTGHWSVIQAAIDSAAGSTEEVNIHIRAGTWNFVEVNEPWQAVTVDMSDFPAGISIFGAPTERTSGLPVPEYGMNPNDQVLNDNWRTVLRMPYEVPQSGDPTDEFFQITGNGDPDRPFRLSDIKLVGYREIDINSETMYIGVDIWNVANVRIDHCYLRNVCGDGIFFRASDNQGISGVVDHCKLINSYGIPHQYLERTVGYGIGFKSYIPTLWESTDKVLGKYTNYSVFVEDSYFEKWRHVIATSNGMHYVFRYNTIQYDYACFSIDNHGNYNMPTRATEIYGNELLDCIEPPNGNAKYAASQLNSGDIVAFDNHVDSSYKAIHLGQ